MYVSDPVSKHLADAIAILDAEVHFDGGQILSRVIAAQDDVHAHELTRNERVWLARRILSELALEVALED